MIGGVGVQVNQDGVISLGDVLYGINSPVVFPTIATSTPLMAVYWADVNTSSNDGQIYYRHVTRAGRFRGIVIKLSCESDTTVTPLADLTDFTFWISLSLSLFSKSKD